MTSSGRIIVRPALTSQSGIMRSHHTITSSLEVMLSSGHAFRGHVSQTMPHQITLFSVWACTSSAVTSSSGQIVIRSHHHDSSSRVSRGIVMFHISLVSDCGVSSRSMMSHVTGRLLRKCCLRHVVRLVN